MSDKKTPQKSNVNTPAQNTGPFIPVLPPIQLPVVIVESNNNMWI